MIKGSNRSLGKESAKLLATRLYNQQVVTSSFDDPIDVVSWFGALQSQDFHSAIWAVGLRLENGTLSQVGQAFNQGSILRTHVLRPTWHFVTARDIKWLLDLTAPRIKQVHGSYFRKFEVDDVAVKANRVFIKALRDEQFLSRNELRDLVRKAGIDVSDPTRFLHILFRAELDQVICSGPRRGKQLTYALFDERADVGRTFSREEALAELAARYFKSHGPAQLSDFVWWSGLSVTEARKGLQSINAQTFEIDRGDDRKFYYLGDLSRRSAGKTLLLPTYDEYFVAYRDRQDLIPTGMESPERFWLGPAVVINGQVVGTWTRTVVKGSPHADVAPFGALTHSEKGALNVAVQRYQAFHNPERAKIGS